MYTIATLDDLRRHLGLSATDTDDDLNLLHSLQHASHLIESLTQRRYCLSLQTRAILVDQVDPRQLILPADLLELRMISDAGGPLDLKNVQLLPTDRDEPASILQLLNGASFQLDTGAALEVTIDGVWGWHDRWTQAWRDSGDTLSAGQLDEAETTLSVHDSAGNDEAGFSTRFQVGHLLRIEDEVLRLTAIDRANHRLTVMRGVQGTAATAHRSGAKIETYTPALAIRDLTLRYAELMLKTSGLLNDTASPLLERMRRLTA